MSLLTLRGLRSSNVCFTVPIGSEHAIVLLARNLTRTLFLRPRVFDEALLCQHKIRHVQGELILPKFELIRSGSFRVSDYF